MNEQKFCPQCNIPLYYQDGSSCLEDLGPPYKFWQCMGLDDKNGNLIQKGCWEVFTEEDLIQYESTRPSSR